MWVSDLFSSVVVDSWYAYFYYYVSSQSFFFNLRFKILKKNFHFKNT
jgi:hypothetical protein